MAQFIGLVISGAVAGGLYAMMASGLVLTYQASGIFNLAHGAIAFVVALCFYVLHQPATAGGIGLATLPAAVIAILVVAPALGMVLDAVVFRRLAGASETVRLTGAIGVLVALPAAALLAIQAMNALTGSRLPTAAGEQGIAPPGLGPSPARSWSLTTGVAVSSDQIAVVVAAAVAAVGLWLMMRHTRLGLETRAGVDRRDLAALRGIDAARSSRMIWIISATLAGLAGVLIAPLFDLSAITFSMIVFISFTAAVAARLRSIPVAFGAGLLLGVVQNIVNGYAPKALSDISGFRSSVPFILLLVLMFFLPSRTRAGGTVAEEAPPGDPRSDLPRWRRWAPWALSSLGLAAYMFWAADGYWRGIVLRGLVLGLVFLSFVVVTGLGGMINLAQATFVTVGGFTVGWLVNHQWASTIPVIMDNGRLTFWAALVVAMVVTAIVGLATALPSLRLGGLSLALATLAIAFIGDRLVFQLEGVRNGSRGWSVPRRPLGPLDLADDKVLFVVLLLVIFAVVGVIVNMQRSATGRAVLAVRSSEVAAAASGVHPVRTKMTVFAVSAALAGLAGGFFAMLNSPMTNRSAPPMLGIVWLAVAVTFGIRRPAGAVLAGVVYSALPAVLGGIGRNWSGAPWSSIPGSMRELLADASLAALLFGLGAVSLAREPDGVLAQVGAALRRSRRPARGRRETPPDRAEAPEGRTTPTGETHDGALLTVRGVHAGYGEVEVLHGVDLEIRPGETVCLFGANGSGKTTLGSVISGLVATDAGTVRFDGQDVTSLLTHERAAAGMFVVPEARGVFPGLAVEDNLRVPLRDESARESVYRRFVVLGERRSQPAGSLSGGEQQQLSLAPALVEAPRLLIADEPMLGLSPLMVETVTESLRELRQAGVAMLLIEEAASVLDIADRVVVMRGGRVVFEGEASQVDAGQLADLYLGAVPR